VTGTAFGKDWGATMAAPMVFTLPVLVFFLLVQTRMLGGLTGRSVNG
jgi:N,N'-diacetylchitobiose transport system permease protein